MVSFFLLFPTKESKSKKLFISQRHIDFHKPEPVTTTAAKITPNISQLLQVSKTTLVRDTHTVSAVLRKDSGDKYSCRFQLLQRSSSLCLSYRHCRCPNTVPAGGGGGGELSVIPGRSTSGSRPRSSCRRRCQTRRSSSGPRTASPAAAWQRTHSRLLRPEGGANTALTLSANGDEQVNATELSYRTTGTKCADRTRMFPLSTHCLSPLKR